MHETAEERRALQDLLDASYARAGAHLRDIHTAAARLTAEELIARLDGMRVLVVATVSSAGRPFTGPVDAFLLHGRFHLGTSPQALRARHLETRDAVSATYVEGEGLVVTVHGRAERVGTGPDTAYGRLLRRWYGEGAVAAFMADTPAWAITAERLFAADMAVHQREG